MMSTVYHETELSPKTREIHRALASLIEELEAIDWYTQRIDATGDGELKSILTHNRDEEVEHAAMALEWLRRMLPPFDKELRTYLFTSRPIAEAERAEGGNGAGPGESGAGTRGDLGLLD